ncbi:MAG TPA: hypothetical protein VMB21_03300 [Candidatus Limnocylindria bacterium]|nr:hypothetical protein [Candidatus Limnocylindria bacterium]
MPDNDPRFKSLYGKPTAFSDPYGECPAEIQREILGKKPEQMGLRDFSEIFAVGVAPATYEEGLYFLPEAFDCLRRNIDGDGIQIDSAVVWFLSHHADRLKTDNLLAACRNEMERCFAHWTHQFFVTHFDRAACEAKGWRLKRYNIVSNSQVLNETIEALERHETHRAWGESFIAQLAGSENDPLRSAWFLEYAREGTACLEQSLLERHARTVLEATDLFDAYPTYWEDIFTDLNL